MTKSEQDRELVLQRELPFPRELIWQALTEPEHQNRWWGPDGFRNEDVTMDFRVGGAWTFVMVGPDGTRYPNHCVFKEIVPPSRWVFDHGDGQRIWFEATVTLEETAKGTLLTLRQLYPSQESRDEVIEKYDAVEGGKQHLAKLEAYVRSTVATMSPINTYLAVFTGSKTSARAVWWDTLPETQRRAKEQDGIAAWKAWMEKHHAAVVTTGGPLGKTKRASSDGISDVSNPLAAFTVVRADSHEAAAKMFENHPHFTIFPGDAIEIMPVLPIPGA